MRGPVVSARGRLTTTAFAQQASSRLLFQTVRLDKWQKVGGKRRSKSCPGAE